MSHATRVTSLRQIAACLWITMVGACSTLQVGSDFDRSANFSGLHQFSIMQRKHEDVQNPLVVTRAEEAIRRELSAKAYIPASDEASADFTVDFTIGSKERTDVNSFPDAYAGAGWGWGRRGWWGGGYWGSDLDVRQYREGTLSIDVFDAHTHRPVWHGWAKKELSRKDIEESETPIRNAVAAVLARFPPR
jgi:hypothetical protein